MNFDLASLCVRFSDLVAATTLTDPTHNLLDLETGIGEIVQVLRNLSATRSKLYIIGNGGSAAIAAHAVTDFVNTAGISALTLHDASVLTCMTNDYGYETAFARMITVHANRNDMLIAISSSGRSKNIRNAVEAAHDRGAGVITLSGFDADNPLRGMGKYNFWLDAHDYGLVEIGHQFILHNLSDRIATHRR